MKVVAIRQGFHGGALRAVGDEFEVADGSKASWYALVDGAPRAVKAKAKKDEPVALSQVQKDDGKPMADVLA